MLSKQSKIVIASNNSGKLREFQALLTNCGFIASPQCDYQVPEPEETGLSFVENALLKARNAAQHTGLPSLADDSGIKVDALDGAPGIYSARFAGKNANDAQNNLKLLESLKNLPASKRTARYQCVIVFMRSATDPTPIICQGSWEGTIVEKPSGQGGFGYDPLFWLADYQCTAAEISSEEKNRISHRALAMNQLLIQLQTLSK